MRNIVRPQRDTRQRRLILDAVLRHFDHPSAEEIYMDVHARDSKISKATVYRNLKVLSENGDILHVKVHGADRYDRTSENHYHILCTVCGKVIDSPLEYAADRDVFTEEKTGFRILRHRTVFEGVCPDCQEKQRSCK